MNVRKLALSLLALPLLLAACGEEGGGGEAGNLLPADAAYFANQQFECGGTAGEFPACPPAFCEVDINGAVFGCETACNTVQGDLYYCTAFQGPTGVDLCVPVRCDVAADGTTTCSEDGCSEDDVTCYFMDRFESSCG